MTKNYYFEEQRYGNTPSGAPNKATFVYAETGVSKDLFLKDIHTYQYDSARQMLNKKQQAGYYEKDAQLYTSPSKRDETVKLFKDTGNFEYVKKKPVYSQYTVSGQGGR